jgi:cytochrome c peroxidase
LKTTLPLQVNWRKFFYKSTAAGLLGLTPTLFLAQTVLTPPAVVSTSPANAPPGADTSTGLGPGQGIIAKTPYTAGYQYSPTQWAIALGKALFWDQQMGSDNTACASCHFHAGSDTRLRNQLNPGADDVTFGPSGDVKFGSTRSDTNAVTAGNMPSGAKATSNYLLQSTDFPLEQLADETNRNSLIVTTTNDRIGTEGTFGAAFGSVLTYGQEDQCSGYSGSPFNVPGTNPALAARQTTPRQAPSVINAVFNHRNFWDGRANNMFNGVGTFGMRDIIANPAARLVVYNKSTPQLTYLTLANASLASQAVTPVLNAVETSCNGRTFPEVATKLFNTIPLFFQKVSASDSVLGPLSNSGSTGLVSTFSYQFMIEQAFDPRWWSAPGTYTISSTGALKSTTAAKGGYSQMALNFSMFEGIAVMMYESTLISNQTPYDTLLSQGQLIPTGIGCIAGSGVNPLVARGCQLFFAPPPNIIPGVPSGGGCALCHSGALMSEGAVVAGQPNTPMLQAFEPDGVIGTHDLGYINIGVQPVFTDQLNGRVDAYNNPLSYVRQYLNYLNAQSEGNPNASSFLLDPDLQQAVALAAATPPGSQSPLVPPPPANFSSSFVPFGPVSPGNVSASKLEVDGTAKVPQLRNVGLTPPYFVTGGFSNLREVIRVYNRGVNSRTITFAGDPNAYGSTTCTHGDDSGSGTDGNHPWPVQDTNCGSNITGLIFPLGLADCNAPVNGVPQPNAACLAAEETPANDDLAALTAFLLALTDQRVQCSAAPFDHPSLTVVDGQTATQSSIGTGTDIASTYPAVGSAGYSATSGYCIPNAGDLFATGMQADSGGAKAPPLN